MKVMVVFGTRPEVIKLAPVVAEAQRRSDVQLTICSTGQHREMLHQAMNAFGIQPDIDLAVIHANQTLPSLTARLMEALGTSMRQSAPDVVLVQGDTTTAFVAALSAFYLHIPVGHVEAGLRTGDLASPFPEELNRVLIARMARWHFAPTAAAVSSLRAEGVDGSRIHLTGNTVLDAIAAIQQRWRNAGDTDAVRLAKSLFPGRELVLITAHRRENQGPAMHQICVAIRTLCEQHPELGFVFPVHMSPTVRTVVNEELSGNITNLLLIDPVDFEANLYLQSRSRLIITDSGGIQEEAPSFAVPTVVMRDHTERMEGVANGFSILAGTNTETIIRAANTLLADATVKERLSSKINPYGDGLAAKRIFDVLQGLPLKALSP